MADPFVIYTMGDTNLFMAALNGVAMLFSGPDLYSGRGPLGLGFGAFFGAVILLSIMVYNAAFKKQMDIRLLLAPLIVYIILTVPKVDIALEDIYGQEATKRVDNIPIGLALPASVASGLSKLLTAIFEQGYSVVSGNQARMPTITEDGYVTPLKLINALRSASVFEGNSSLYQTVNNFYSACINNNETFSADEFRKSENPLDYLITKSRNSAGLVHIIQAGTADDNPQPIVSCEKGAKVIKAALESYMDGVKVSEYDYNILGDISKNNLRQALNGHMISNGSASGASPNNTANSRGAGINGYMYQDVADAIGTIANVSESQARNFIAATLFNPYMESASLCSDKSKDMSSMAKCTAWVSSVNQWEEKNAAAATGFLKVMQDGQNVLILFSFLLFPIIVLFIMFQGVSSFKILGNYLAFTVSAYMWIPMASIINFTIQFTLMEQFDKLLAQSGALTLYTASQFYGAVAQKLSIANGMLASVPVLCMMMFSGMMMGMNQLASRMNSAEGGNYDAKVNSPDLQNSAPIAATNSAVSVSGQGVVSHGGVMKASVQASSTFSAAQQVSEANSRATANAQSKVADVYHGVEAGRARSSSNDQTLANSQSRTDGTNNQSGTSYTSGNMNSTASNHREGAAVSTSASRSEVDADMTVKNGSFQGSLGAAGNPFSKNSVGKDGKPGADQSPIQGSIGGQGAITWVGNEGTNHTKSTNIGENEDASLTTSTGAQSNRMNQKSSSTSAAFQDGYSNSKAMSYLNSDEVKEAIKKGWVSSDAVEEAKSAVAQAQYTQQRADSLALNMAGDASELVGSINMLHSKEYQQLSAAIAYSSDRDNIMAKAEQFGSRTGLVNPEDRTKAGIIFAAMSSPDKNVSSLSQSMINPQVAAKQQEIGQQIGNTPIERPKAGNFQPINTQGLNPGLANNIKSIGVNPEPPKKPSASAVTGRPKPVSALPKADIPQKNYAKEAVQTSKPAIQHVKDAINKS